CAARLERTSPARHRKRPRPPASPQRRRENLARRTLATTRPRASLQPRRRNRTRRPVTTRPRASPQRRRENRTRAVAMTAPNPNRVPAATLENVREREHQQRLADRMLWVAVFAAFASGCSALAAIINLLVQSLAR